MVAGVNCAHWWQDVVKNGWLCIEETLPHVLVLCGWQVPHHFLQLYFCTRQRDLPPCLFGKWNCHKWFVQWTQSELSVLLFFMNSLADFGVSAKNTKTLQRRDSFIGTPYWWVMPPLTKSTFFSVWMIKPPAPPQPQPEGSDRMIRFSHGVISKRVEVRATGVASCPARALRS